jgi:hypothetical protein
VSIYSCTQFREVAPELALGVLSGAERAEAIIHANGCARCQALVNEFTEVADALPLLAPEHEPPPGFERRVLAAGKARRRRVTRRWIASVAAVAAAAAILSITIVRVVDAGNDTSPAVATAEPVAARMVTNTGGWNAGWAYVTNGTSVAVTVNYQFGTGRYRIVGTPPDGASATMGTIAVVDGQGSWTGHSPVNLGPGATIELVGPNGDSVCHGTVAPRA